VRDFSTAFEEGLEHSQGPYVSRRLLEGDVHCGKLLRSVGIGRLIALSDFAVPGNLESAVPYSATLGGERRYGVGGGMLRHGRISQCRVTMGSVVPYAATLGGGGVQVLLAGVISGVVMFCSAG
jgi:hypothetical protein